MLSHHTHTPTSHFHPALMSRPSELCQLTGSYRGGLSDSGWVSEEKVDGWRALRFMANDGSTRLWSRNGVPIEGTGHILHRLALMERVAGVPMMFDGEFQVDGTLAATKAWAERGWKTGGEAGTFFLFDGMTLSDWQMGGTDVPLYERQATIADLFDRSFSLDCDWAWRAGTRGKEPACPHVTKVESIYVADHGDVMSEAQRVWSRQGEGLMLKRLDSPYTRTRSNDWMKVKR